ncbi:N,N-dimethylformamidase beta subunit family domain-containing protein [Actinocrispum sp. NPDC049592]|uniref:N,N-dimethylformamidase beta subunit family domain-containing protein n=1 Tax=Actinocrispum sp. NPDC049592 TaxID=3154835 RepID=UPI0034340C97
MPRKALGWMLPVVLVAGFAVGAEAEEACVNKVVCENRLVGSPGWMAQSVDDSVVGYTDDISYSPGDVVTFKVRTDAPAYQIDIYRLGYYGGVGARWVGAVSRSTPQTQPPCVATDPTGLVDCGNWAPSVSYQVPDTAVSGIYYAVLKRADTQRQNEIVFVVRDDGGRSDVLFQTSDATWQAYNTFGKNSLYTGSGPGNGGSAFKVSYNRPILARNSDNFVFNAEYPMVRFMERNGFDVSYTTDVDTARRGGLLKQHKVFMPVGHDEYWSNEQRVNVEAARDAGVNLAFLTGNEIFWKTRWENDWRTLVSYKETKTGQTDPTPIWTGSWRDPRRSPPKDGGRPENALLGQLFTVTGVRNDELTVPAEYGKMRLWRNTNIGQGFKFQPGTLGFEWDSVEDNGFQPPGVARLSRTTVPMTGNYVLRNNGDDYGPGTKTHALTLYKSPSGALVFAAGTVQWSWGLDDQHLRATGTPTSDIRIQQATVNLLADMGVHGQLIPDLTDPTSSMDIEPPTTTFTSPTTPTVGTSYTIEGTVTDTAGQPAGVEVSTDGSTWHPADWEPGASTWRYTFTPAKSGDIEVKVRAVDDSANLSAPQSQALAVATRPCPCGILAGTPATADVNDPTVLELGIRFQSEKDGQVQGIRFYKGKGNTGQHNGTLWTADGRQLATGAFTNETPEGWQTMTFDRPVAVTAGTQYVASYHTNTGHYAADPGYFATPQGIEPLNGLTGLFRVGSTAFPDRTYQNTNYWVDVVFGY